MKNRDKYYRQERKEIIESLKTDKLARIDKIDKLEKELRLDWEKLMLLIHDRRNLYRQIMRERALLNNLRNIEE